MDRTFPLSLLLAAVLGVGGISSGAESHVAPLSAGLVVPASNLPVVFEPNQGQAPPEVRYLSRGQGLLTLILDDEIVLMPARGGRALKAGAGEATTDGPLRIRFAGSQTPAGTVGSDPTGGVSNYYRGRDREGWREGVPHYRRVVMREIYPGVDVAYHDNAGRLEFDFEVAPGIAPDKVLLAIEGASRIDSTESGDVQLTFAGGQARLRRPSVYQWVAGQRVEIPAAFEAVDEKHLAFEIGVYDETRPLVIDPIVEYATFLGGSFDDKINAATMDAAGNAYVVGSADSFNYPTLGGFDTVYDAPLEAIITKMNPQGTGLVFSTFLGSGDIEAATAVSLDGNGHIYVAGYTETDGGPFEFPTTPGAYSAAPSGGREAWVARIDPAAGTLFFSTLLGGPTNDTPYAIRVDAAGAIHVAGETGGSFPTTPGAYDRIYDGGGSDLFYAKLNATGSSLLYSTYIGAEGTEQGPAMQLDADGDVYLAATTDSLNLPVTPGVLQSKRAAGIDLFVLKMDASGKAPKFLTYIGGNRSEGNVSLVLDAGRNIYLSGFTEGFGFPVSADALFPTVAGERDAFILKLDMTASQLLYGTFIGGSGADVGAGLAVDAEGSIVFAGTTTSPNLPVTAEANDSTYSGGQDAFIAKLSSSGDRLLYSSYFGEGNTLSVARASLFLDSFGRTVVAGSHEFKGAPGFPSTPGAYRTNRPGQGPFNGYVVKFDLTGFGGVPQIAAGGITGAGLSVPPIRAISPNGLFTIYGTIFVPEGEGAQVLPEDLVDGRIPTRLLGVCVDVSGTRANMFAVTPKQLNVQAPTILPPDLANVTVITDCDGPNEKRSNVAKIATAAATPEFFYFAFNEDGFNPIAARNILTGELIGPPGLFGKGSLTTVPAYNLDYVVLFGTGFGLTDPPLQAGELAGQAASVVLPASVKIGGVDVRDFELLYVGAAPGFAGLYQVNLQVRRAVPPGNQPVLLQIGGAVSSPGGYIPVQPRP